MRSTAIAGVLLASLAACGIFLPPGDAVWTLGDDTVVGPETTSFDALVTEVACASGESSEGRVVGPQITYSDEAVTITFSVRPLGGLAQDCQGNPPTSVTVTLDGPLGDRTLIDGGADPPREVPR